ncbi:hypothetical protein JCM5296_007584 [Sporobolomyces johnsonii]
MTFLAGSNQNNYSFVKYTTQTPVKEPSSLRKAGALDVTLDPDVAPIAGEYIFVPEDPDTDNFRMWLLSRDGFCLYDEDVDPLECYAVHIVPQNRDNDDHYYFITFDMSGNKGNLHCFYGKSFDGTRAREVDPPDP